MSATKTTKGLLGTKLGMTQVWDENNVLVPVTVIEITPNVVTQVRTEEKDGYSAVQIAYGQIDPRKVNQPAAGHFKAAIVPLVFFPARALWPPMEDLLRLRRPRSLGRISAFISGFIDGVRTPVDRETLRFMR